MENQEIYKKIERLRCKIAGEKMSDEIVLDGKKYIVFEKHLKELQEIRDTLKLLEEKNFPKKTKHFKIDKQIKLIKSMESLGFKLVDNPLEIDNNPLCITEPCNILMVEGKTEEAKNLLTNFADEDNIKIGFEYKSFWEKGCSTYEKESLFTFSSDYLIKSMRLLNINSEATRILTKETAFPIVLENQHFRIVLAPRVQADEDKMWGVE